MERRKTTFTENILANLRKIMNDRNLTQATLATYAGISESQFSRVLKGTVQLSFKQLENIASRLSMQEIDIITYPDKYVPQHTTEQDSDTELLLQLRLKKEKKDQVMKVIFGKHDIEILNH